MALRPADVWWHDDGPTALVFAAAMAWAPLGVGQEARLTAWLDWAAACRGCYEPVAVNPRHRRGIHRALHRGHLAP